MSHMVIYRSVDGKPAYHQVEEIHDAVAYVEQLRNDQGVEHATIHRMEQVNFEYRPYFRVELRSGSSQLNAAPSTPAVVAAAPMMPSAESVPAASTTPAASEPSAPSADQVVQTASPAPSESAAPASEPAPSVTSTDGGLDVSDNGVGARRGLFGR